MLILLAVIVGGFILYGLLAQSAQVTLRAAPGNTKVQMFDKLRSGSNVKVTTFPAGLRCTKLGDMLRYNDDGGPPMYFYKLTCDGTTGYVNADWVRPY